MVLRDIMTPNPACTHPDETLQQAAIRMRDLDVGPLPVCENNRLTGMITDRDITIRAIADGKDPKTAMVREAMTTDFVFGYEDQDLADAARVMEKYQIRRLAVLDRDKRLVGIVSLGDLAVTSGAGQAAGEVLRNVSEPAIPQP